MAQPPQELSGDRPTFPGMPTSPIVNALRRKRAQISGEIRELDKQMHALRSDLAHIDATLKMFAPGTEPKLIKPKRPYRPRNRLFERKELSVRVLRIIRETEGAGATLGAITGRVMADKGIAPEATQTIQRLTMIVLKSQTRRGAVTKTADEPPRWVVTG